MTIGELLADPGLMKPPETVPSGWHAFDRAQPFGGAERGTITILAAPPKCYKTFTMLRLARGFAERGHRVAWLAGEMRPHALARRMLCQYARIGQSALASEVMPPDLAERFGKALRDLDAKVEGRIALKRAPIGFADLRQAGESADVVFVDYLQMVQHPDPSIKGNERIEGTMAEMIGVATRTNAVFIVAAAQPADGAGADRTLFNCVRGSTSAAYSADAVYCAERPSPTVRDSGAPFSIEYRCLAHREGEEHSFEVAIDPRTGLIAEEGSP
jgi:replicative DNA helicase